MTPGHPLETKELDQRRARQREQAWIIRTINPGAAGTSFDAFDEDAPVDDKLRDEVAVRQLIEDVLDEETVKYIDSHGTDLMLRRVWSLLDGLDANRSITSGFYDLRETVKGRLQEARVTPLPNCHALTREVLPLFDIADRLAERN